MREEYSVHNFKSQQEMPLETKDKEQCWWTEIQ